MKKKSQCIDLIAEIIQHIIGLRINAGVNSFVVEANTDKDEISILDDGTCSLDRIIESMKPRFDFLLSESRATAIKYVHGKDKNIISLTYYNNCEKADCKYDTMTKIVSISHKEATSNFDRVVLSTGLRFPYASFCFYKNGELEYGFSGNGAECVVGSFFGSGSVADFVKIKPYRDNSGIGLEGYILSPHCEKEYDAEYLYINGEQVTNELLHAQIARAYKSFSDRNKCASYVIYVQALEGVSVRKAADVLYQVVSRELLACTVSLFRQEGFDRFAVQKEKRESDYGQRKYNYEGGGAALPEYGTPKSPPSLKLCVKHTFDKYAIAYDPKGSDTYIIDVEKGIELLLYTETRNAYRSGRPDTVEINPPYEINVDKGQRIVLFSFADDLKRIGFDIEKYGKNQIRIVCRPAMYDFFDTAGFCADLTDVRNYPLSATRIIAYAAKRATRVSFHGDRFLRLMECLEDFPLLRNTHDEAVMMLITSIKADKIFTNK